MGAFFNETLQVFRNLLPGSIALAAALLALQPHLPSSLTAENAAWGGVRLAAALVVAYMLGRVLGWISFRIAERSYQRMRGGKGKIVQERLAVLRTQLIGEAWVFLEERFRLSTLSFDELNEVQSYCKDVVRGSGSPLWADLLGIEGKIVAVLSSWLPLVLLCVVLTLSRAFPLAVVVVAWVACLMWVGFAYRVVHSDRIHEIRAALRHYYIIFQGLPGSTSASSAP